MGYCIRQRESCFEVFNKESALAAIKALATQTHRMNGGSSDGSRWFSWVNTSEFLNAKTFEEAMRAWRWDYGDEDFETAWLDFTGEKSGDDKILFDAIAPFVKAGSYIEMEGEDGEIWRWCFNGHSCETCTGRVTFD